MFSSYVLICMAASTHKRLPVRIKTGMFLKGMGKLARISKIPEVLLQGCKAEHNVREPATW